MSEQNDWLEQQTRKIAIGDKGLFVRVRRLPLEVALRVGKETKGVEDGDTKLLGSYREIARLAVVSPKFVYEATDNAEELRWDDISVADQVLVVKAVMELTTEGVEAAKKAAENFSGGGSGGVRDGGAGKQPDQTRQLEPATLEDFGT